ncbi:MAG TPA: replicative helicase loader/inhibitor [Nocardioides sp.]
MNADEIPQLIAQIALADPRVRREDKMERRAQIIMWAGILAEVPYDFAIQAVQAHYANSQWPIAPGDIASSWQGTVRDRLNRDNGTFEPNDYPDLDPDDIVGYLQALRGQRQAVAQGHQPPNNVKAITAGPAADEVTARLKTLGTYVPRQVDEALDAHRPVKAARRAALMAGEPDALSVDCDWCQAPASEPCRSRRVDPNGGATANRRRSTPHPSRLDDAREAHQQREAETA